MQLAFSVVHPMATPRDGTDSNSRPRLPFDHNPLVRLSDGNQPDDGYMVSKNLFKPSKCIRRNNGLNFNRLY
jgi:hypothetical protein